jgi:murein DD-endopeptidase MepM/ murein hydrolase activator NlpD
MRRRILITGLLVLGTQSCGSGLTPVPASDPFLEAPAPPAADAAALHAALDELSRLSDRARPRLARWLDAAATHLSPRRGPAEPRALVVVPVDGELSSAHGYRRDPFHGRRRHHNGVDWRAARGTPVHAAGPGTVVTARRMRGYGRVVIIEHGRGVETRYAHLHRIEVSAGAPVAAGERIGTVGSSGRATGPHLHFEVRHAGRPVDPQLAFARGVGWDDDGPASEDAGRDHRTAAGYSTRLPSFQR